jgi:hypothetical protein
VVYENLFSFSVVIIIYRVLEMHVIVVQLEGEDKSVAVVQSYSVFWQVDEVPFK